MSKQALGAFERQENGDWVCVATKTIQGLAGDVEVHRGLTIHPHTTFAGRSDFGAYLDSIAIENPSIAR